MVIIGNHAERLCYTVYVHVRVVCAIYMCGVAERSRSHMQQALDSEVN